mmetsp:Transcript_11029/g.22306  ORF Transcript_11029/g.22306 Transcript_11029/m.22306 type:complete len:203 (+) Transcript_11029:2-610(+)
MEAWSAQEDAGRGFAKAEEWWAAFPRKWGEYGIQSKFNAKDWPDFLASEPGADVKYHFTGKVARMRVMGKRLLFLDLVVPGLPSPLSAKCDFFTEGRDAKAFEAAAKLGPDVRLVGTRGVDNRGDPMLMALGAKFHVPRPNAAVIKSRYDEWEAEGLRTKEQGWYTMERTIVIDGWKCWDGVKCASAQEYDEHLASLGGTRV